ncbi:hypothetical protein ACNP8W_003945 [Klebsiella variicola]
MKNLKIAYVDEKLVAIECDGLSCSSLPVSEFLIDRRIASLSTAARNSERGCPTRQGLTVDWILAICRMQCFFVAQALRLVAAVWS